VAGIIVVAIGVVLFMVPAAALDLDPRSLRFAGIATVISGAGAVAAAVSRPSWIPGSVALAGLVQMLALQFSLFSTPGTDVVERVAVEIRARLHSGVQWTSHDIFVRNLVFYVGTRQRGPFDDDAKLLAFLRGQPALAVMTLREYERLAPLVGAPLHEIGRWRFFNASAIRIRTLVERNPERELRTVVLVSNRPLSSR
jgi:hypothetical protein